MPEILYHTRPFFQFSSQMEKRERQYFVIALGLIFGVKSADDQISNTGKT